MNLSQQYFLTTSVRFSRFKLLSTSQTAAQTKQERDLNQPALNSTKKELHKFKRRGKRSMINTEIRCICLDEFKKPRLPSALSSTTSCFLAPFLRFQIKHLAGRDCLSTNLLHSVFPYKLPAVVLNFSCSE